MTPISLHPTSRQLRYGGWVLALLALLGAGWWGPWSPQAADRAAMLLASGQAQAALVQYERAGQWAFSSQQRIQALRQAALVAEVELGDAARARSLLAQVVAQAPSAHQAAEACADLARLSPDPAQAAGHWRDAAALAPDHPQQGAWWLAAGQALLQSGQPQAAHQALQAAAAHSAQAAAAHLALGRLALDAGDAAQARSHFHAALSASSDGLYAELAREGLRVVDQL